MSKIRFTKMHGCGNDYIYVDTMQYPIADPVQASILWSDRHKGIGSDGLVLIGASPIPEADYSMRIFNADGSEAMMCGNASRCVGKYVYEKNHPWPLPVIEGNGYQETKIRLLTKSGIKILYLRIVEGIVESVTVDMGEPTMKDERLFNTQHAEELRLAISDWLPTANSQQLTANSIFVSMGNPHFVIFVDDINGIDVARYGSLLENHEAFPERCNIEFAQMTGKDEIRMRVWERGSGITMACGTGACATAVAAALTRESQIHMDGGTLRIHWDEADRHVYMTGPAEFVFEGDI